MFRNRQSTEEMPKINPFMNLNIPSAPWFLRTAELQLEFMGNRLERQEGKQICQLPLLEGLSVAMRLLSSCKWTGIEYRGRLRFTPSLTFNSFVKWVIRPSQLQRLHFKNGKKIKILDCLEVTIK